jgi:DNA recombination protein RmuC
VEAVVEIVVMALIGIAAGLTGWFLATSRIRRENIDSRTRAEGDLRVSESANTELRAKVSEMRAGLDNKDRQISELHQQLRLESELKAAAQAELKEIRSALEGVSIVRDQLGIQSELRAVAETRLKGAEKNLEEQKKLLEEATARLTDTFSALSAEALKSNNSAFLELANSAFAKIRAESVGDLETRQNAINGLVSPLRDSLSRYEEQILEMESKRQKDYGSLEEQLRTLNSANEQLQKETGSLVTALRTPHVRGRWGEMTLRRTAELAGMSDRCDFNEQESFESDGGRQRPDMIVNLPGGRRIAVDAKVPLQAFLDALAGTTEEERKAQFARHAQLVRVHMNQLGARSYWEQFPQAPEIVVLFLPGESFFSAALEQDRTLIEDGMEKRVVLATPTTLITLLRAIGYGWRQEELAKNTQEISDLGRQLHDRIRAFVAHFEGIGSSLGKAVETYNKARASLETRVLPGARKFKELRAASSDDIMELEAIDEVPSALPIPDLIEPQ